MREFHPSISTVEKLAKETGATLLVLPGATGGEKGIDEYPQLIDYIISKLAQAQGAWQMTQFFAVMLVPIIACLLLAGIHGYLGIHIVSRQVIFTDLAMAQIAALGAAVAMLFHFEVHSTPTYFFSLAFTLFGALVLAGTQFRDGPIPRKR